MFPTHVVEGSIPSKLEKKYLWQSGRLQSTHNTPSLYKTSLVRIQLGAIIYKDVRRHLCK